MDSEIYSSIAEVGQQISIGGILVINVLLIVITYLFTKSMIGLIQKIRKRRDVLKGKIPQTVGTLILYLVFVALQASVLV